MSTLNPPAFPAVYPDPVHSGMTMLDWFAGQVLPAAMTQAFCISQSIGKQSPVEWAADVSYRVARAMLADRTKGGA